MSKTSPKKGVHRARPREMCHDVAKHLARFRRAGIVRYVGPKRGGLWEVHQPVGTRG